MEPIMDRYAMGCDARAEVGMVPIDWEFYAFSTLDDMTNTVVPVFQNAEGDELARSWEGDLYQLRRAVPYKLIGDRDSEEGGRCQIQSLNDIFPFDGPSLQWDAPYWVEAKHLDIIPVPRFSPTALRLVLEHGLHKRFPIYSAYIAKNKNEKKKETLVIVLAPTFLPLKQSHLLLCHESTKDRYSGDDLHGIQEYEVKAWNARNFEILWTPEHMAEGCVKYSTGTPYPFPFTPEEVTRILGEATRHRVVQIVGRYPRIMHTAPTACANCWLQTGSFSVLLREDGWAVGIPVHHQTTVQGYWVAAAGVDGSRLGWVLVTDDLTPTQRRVLESVVPGLIEMLNKPQKANSKGRKKKGPVPTAKPFPLCETVEDADDVPPRLLDPEAAEVWAPWNWRP
eukprot:TRINITY_DN74_c7_g1_i2.p1 TRINITY_DN74_c7_g1~~TRINITY_DN74_c7_g1_i2.p1  ORF type:complete len:415 (+),score=79.02 TRINITY_DN74_c7_g1_i2:63-1247(+)